MKKFLKILGIAIALLIIVFLTAGMWVNFSSAPTYPTQSPQLTALPDSNSLQRGAKMVKHVCATCHLGADGKLSGQLMSTAESDFGEFWSGNITQHPTAGIGRYSDEELAFLFRTGIKKDGHFAGPYMTKVNLSDEDLVSIIKFLRSDHPLVVASEVQPPAPEYSFLAKALEKFGLFVPATFSPQPISAPPAEDTIAFGRYLATQVYECFNCHSASFETNNWREPEQSVGYFGGGNVIELPASGVAVSPNLTMHVEDGLGKYSEDQFTTMVRRGIRLDQSTMMPMMPKFSSLDDEEIHAIWEYLKTVPVLEGN